MSEPRWLTDEEQRAWQRLAAVLELLPSALDAQLVRNEGLTHFEYFTLASLSEAPERFMHTSALSSVTNATLPRLSRVLTGLEKKGLVHRRVCPEDRRSKDVILTDEGLAKVVRAAPAHVRNVRDLVFDRITAAQVEQLTAITIQILGHLDPEGEVFAQTMPE
jgi:DNA-binding MarR family transcriptional regulator